MSEQNQDVRISFFRPTTDRAKANTRMIIIMVLIWAFAIFGFQILLKVIEKPVQEKTLVAFNSVWSSVESGQATVADQQVFIKSLIAVMGKSIKKEHKETLSKVLSYELYKLDPSLNPKDSVALAQALNLKQDSLEVKLLPFFIITNVSKELCQESMSAVPSIMNLYLTHYQSFLTDTRFLGFPFHYWYTAEFLLILFVALCFIYCKATDKINKKYSAHDDA
ncbi:MAG: sodium/substrate symporter small subunit [Pseudomonadota bacterium]